MNYLVPLSVFNSVMWVIYDHFTKLILNDLNYDKLYIIRSICLSIFVFAAVIFYYDINKITNTVLKLENHTKVYIILTVIIGIVSILIHLWLFQNNKTSNVISTMGGIYIICSLVIGYYFFGEKLQPRQYQGALIILFGAYLVNSSKKHR